MSIRFGIYPGGAVGTADGRILSDRPDDPALVQDAVRRLRGHGPFHLRGYARFTDDRPPGETDTDAPPGLAQYAGEGCTLDLVVQYHSASGDVEGFLGFVRERINAYGSRLSTLQIGEEANVTDNPTLDGAYPGVEQAMIRGVQEARHRATEQGLWRLKVGINSTVLFGPDLDFYPRLVRQGGPAFVRALDYIGLDAFPDVFRPVPGDLRAACAWLIGHHRQNALGSAGLDQLPIHITEHGWPTGPDRPQARQAEVLTAMIETLATRPELRVTHYTHFSLRDAASDGSLFAGFGLMDAEYRPKAAFETYRRLIRQYG